MNPCRIALCLVSFAILLSSRAETVPGFAARTLTRAVSRGEFDELNPVLKYTIPPSE